MEDQSSLVALLVLVIGSAFSPGVFGLAIVAIGSKNKPIQKGLGYLVGAIIVTVGWALLANYISIDSVEASFSDNPILGNIDLFLGLLLIGFGFWTLLPHKKNDGSENNQPKKERGGAFWSWLIIGFIMVLTNADNGLMYFSGIREIANAEISVTRKAIGEIIASIFFLGPILIPLFFAIFFPKTAENLLKPAMKFLKRYGKYIVAIILIGIGLYLIIRKYYG